MKNDQPVVSVCCITYNQESYITEAIESFLMQKTNFPIEIIIHDDASTDNTAHIVKYYAEKFPELIIPIYQRENQYSKQGGILNRFVYPLARGKYIALCEGDDYWTDPLKLQKQVDFLEANPDYGMVYTKARCYEQQTNTYLKTIIGKQFKSFESLFFSIGIPTLTTMFRRYLLKKYYSDIMPYSFEWKMGDYPLWLFIASQSRLYLIDQITATYRILPESASHSNNPCVNLAFIKSTHEIRNFFSTKYAVSHNIINKYTLIYYLNTIYLAYLCNDTQLIGEAKIYFKNYNYYFFGLMLILFEFNKNYRISLRVINKIMHIYAKHTGIFENKSFPKNNSN